MIVDKITVLEPRDTQTQVKHKILDKYLSAWGGIILNGLGEAARRYGKVISSHFVYVDCFAYTGKYSGDVENIWLEKSTGPVVGSSIIGVKVLDDLKSISHRYTNVTLTTNVILIEQDPKRYTQLLQNLECEGFGARIRHTTDFDTLLPEEIAVVNADCTTLSDKLLKFTTKKYTKAFYLIDPYGPSGIPHDFVQSIVRQDGHDVMINFIYLDLHKKTGAVVNDTEISEKQKKHVEHWSQAFGSDEWIKIKQEIENLRRSRDSYLNHLRNSEDPLMIALGLKPDEAIYDPLFRDMQDNSPLTDAQLTELTERKLVELYKTVLIKMDSALAIKVIRLLFPDKDRSMFYLFLTTHDGTGALALNQILFDAKLYESELRYIRNSAKKQLPKNGQMAMFPPEVPEIPKQQAPSRPTIDNCAEFICEKFSGKLLTRREVYKLLADEEYYDSEINKAIALLKKKGKAAYDGNINNSTLITFS